MFFTQPHAIALDAALWTLNTADFDRIPKLEFVRT